MALIKMGVCSIEWVCGKCENMFSLPGIVPGIETLKTEGWKFCPYCGEPIEYEPEPVGEKPDRCGECKYWQKYDDVEVVGFCPMFDRNRHADSGCIKNKWKTCGSLPCETQAQEGE